MKRFAAFALLCAVGCGGDTKSTPVKDLNKQLPPAPMGAGGKKSNSPANRLHHSSSSYVIAVTRESLQVAMAYLALAS